MGGNNPSDATHWHQWENRKKERKKDEVIVETHRQLLHYYPPTLLTSLTSTGRPIE